MRTIFIISILLVIRLAGNSQPAFCGAANATFYSSNVLFPNDLNPTLDGSILPYSSYIIAVFNNNGSWECAGYLQWNGNSVSMVINGSDGNLPGYAVNEPYKFIVQLPDGCVLDSISLEYDISGIYNNSGIFQDGALSKVSSFSVHSKPWVSLQATNGYCGENTALISALASNLGGPYTFQWSNGSSNAEIENLQNGSYSVTVTDAFGCSQSQSASVFNIPAISLQLQTQPSQNGNFCESTVTVEGGTPPFSYAWNNGQTAQTANDLPGGQFSVTVTDASGCTSVQTGSCVPVATNEIEGIDFYALKPNPANSYLSIQIQLSQQEHLRLRLFNPIGQQLYEKSFDSNGIEETIDLNFYPSGFYLLQLSTQRGNKFEIIEITR